MKVKREAGGVTPLTLAEGIDSDHIHYDFEETGRKEWKDKCLTLFGVGGCVLAGVAHHPVQVPGSVLQHVIPGRDEEERCLHTVCSFFIRWFPDTVIAQT